MSPLALENCNEIVDNLYLGGISAAMQTQMLVDQGVRAVVCCVREMEFPSVDFHKDLEYYRVDVEDVSREPIEWFWPEAAQFIHSHMSRDQKVFVHCRAGVSRSASTVIAYLVAYQSYSLYDAFVRARSRRPVVTPNMGFMEKLTEFEAVKRGGEPTISMAKYSSWYCGDQTAAEPDVGTGAAVAEATATTAPADATAPGSAEAAKPGGRVDSPARTRLLAATRKVMSMQRIAHALGGSHNKDEIDLDILPDARISPIIEGRIDKIRRMLLRHAAQDPELGYCQGMHLAAALFTANADSEGEAYARFCVFLKAVRGLWLPGLPLLQTGVVQFEAIARETEWFGHLRAHAVEPGMYLPQAWLLLFTTLLPLETLAGCLELMEANGFAGILAMTLALLDHASTQLMQRKSAEELLREISGLARRPPTPQALAQAMRRWLPRAREAAAAPPVGEQDAFQHCDREGSRVVGKSGHEVPVQWPQLPAWLHEAHEAEVTAVAAVAAAAAAAAAEGERAALVAFPSPPAKTRRPAPPMSCLAWICGPSTRLAAPQKDHRASVKHAEQKQEVDQKRRASVKVLEHMAQTRSRHSVVPVRRRSCVWADQE